MAERNKKRNTYMTGIYRICNHDTQQQAGIWFAAVIYATTAYCDNYGNV